MVISEFDQAREIPLVGHAHLEKNPGKVAENLGQRGGKRVTLFSDRKIYNYTTLAV